MRMGVGRGLVRGDGEGNGIDRGESGAEIPEPQALNSYFTPRLEPLMRPTKSARVEVEVLANGRVGKVKLVQSCGLPEVDAALVRYEEKEHRFAPARHAGVAVDAVWRFELKFYGVK